MSCSSSARLLLFRWLVSLLMILCLIPIFSYKVLPSVRDFMDLPLISFCSWLFPRYLLARMSYRQLETVYHMSNKTLTNKLHRKQKNKSNYSIPRQIQFDLLNKIPGIVKNLASFLTNENIKYVSAVKKTVLLLRWLRPQKQVELLQKYVRYYFPEAL